MKINPVPERIALPAFIACSLAVFFFIYWVKYGRPDVGIDDANIYFVYMKNFAQGHGFVWNVGGEHVEGFSSFLWTVTGSLFYIISPVHFTEILMIFSCLLTFLTVYKVSLFARKLNNTEGRILTATDFIILFLLIGPRGFIEWNMLSLMETSFWCYLLVSTTLMLCNYYFKKERFSYAGFGIMLALLNLTRPESIAYNLIFIGLLFLILLADKGMKYSIRKTAIPLLLHVISLGSLVAWRIYYFGYPLPNTYYAKVSGNEKSNLVGGISYLFSLFNNYPLSIFILPLLIFFFIQILLKWRNKSAFTDQEKIQAVLLTLVFAGLSFPVLTGGDHFHFDRFYQPLLPLFYLAAINYYFWFHYLGISGQSKKIGVVVLSIVLVSFFAGKSTLFSFFRNEPLDFPEFIIAQNGRDDASGLNKVFADCKKYPSIGSLATGGFGYMYNGKTIDMLGLNNARMAHASSVKVGIRNHASFDKGVFWELKPDIMGTVLGCDVVADTTGFVLEENLDNFRDDNNRSMYNIYKKIFDDKEFRENYFPAFVKNIHNDFFVFGYFNKSFLESLDRSLFTSRILERRIDVTGR